MRLTARHWAIAIALSAGAHMGLFARGELAEKPANEASAGTPLAVWGVSANAMTVEAEPVKEPAVEPEPVEEPIEPEKLAELKEPEALPEALSEVAPSVVREMEQKEDRPVEVLEPVEEEVEKPKPKEQTASLGGPVGQAAGNAGKKSNSASGTSISNYSSRVQSHLRRFKRRPGGRATGTVRVAFVLAPDGNVQSAEIVSGSGNPVLDNAALEMVRRAGPFPSFPAGTGKSSWTFTVPVHFKR